MAIIYSYPINTNILATDIIVGSTTVVVNGKQKNQTKNFEIGTLATYFNSVIAPPGSYVPYTGAIASVNLGANDIFTVGGARLADDGSVYGTSFQFAGLLGSLQSLAQSNVAWALPNQGGTIALLSNIPSLTGYVPYIGATGSVNLGAFNLTANSITTTIDSTISGLTVGKGGGAIATNTILGSNALLLNVSGGRNTAIGASALQNNLSTNNTANGYQALFSNTLGNGNTAIGDNALFNTVLGINNVGLGFNARALGNGDTNSIVIGYNAVGIGSQSVVLGNTNILTTVLRGKVGIGTTAPLSTIDTIGSISIKSGLTNTSLRPIVSPGILTTGEIRSYSNTHPTADDGFLRLSAGGGTAAVGKAFIDISGYSTIPDMHSNIVFGTTGAEQMRITKEGDVGIGIATPQSKLHVVGAIKGGSFIKELGTANQYLMADGTTSIAIKATYMMTGVFTNMFGGDPGGLTKDILEWSPTVPAASHSSVLPILQNCRITAAAFKYVSSTPLGTINPGDSWEINLYKMINPLTGSTTADGNFTFVGSLNITLTSANTGTTPGIFSSGLNIVLNAGDIIRIAGNETGVIATSTEEGQLTVLFEVI